jgi:hypothetical protein
MGGREGIRADVSHKSSLNAVSANDLNAMNYIYNLEKT